MPRMVAPTIDAEGEEITIPAAARLLGVSRNTCLNWAYRQLLPARRVGRTYIVPRAAVLQLKAQLAEAA